MKKFDSFILLLKKPSFIFWVYVVVSAGAAVHLELFDVFSPYREGSNDFIMNSSMNNYSIYQDSFLHLIHHENMYGYHWSEYYDWYLYSPSFPFLIMPFAVFPKYVGVVLWCVFNALSLYYAVKWLKIDQSKKVFIWWFILPELLISIQNVQVNPLVAAMFILTFIAFDKGKVGLAALVIACSMFIKVFGIVGASLFLLYPQKFKFIGYFIFWSAVVFLLPLVFVPFSELMVQYQGWYNTIISLHSTNVNDMSVMQMLSSILHFSMSDALRYSMQGIAVLLFCVKYVRYKSFGDEHFKHLFLASILIWTTIFNNAVESPSFVIAITGVSIWYIAETKNKLNLVLLIIALVLTSFSHSDIFPRYVRDHFVDPYALKCLPCFLIWLKVEFELISHKRAPAQVSNV